MTIEARQYTGQNTQELVDWIIHEGQDALNMDGVLHIWTLESKGAPLVASPGDMIIKGVRGEFYPCKPDIFDKTYEAA